MATKKAIDRDQENTVAALDKIKRGYTDIEDAHGKIERAIDVMRDERDEARTERDSSIAAHKAEVSDLKAKHTAALAKADFDLRTLKDKLGRSLGILTEPSEIR